MKPQRLTPEEVLEFIEESKKLFWHSQMSGPSQAISLRVPKSLLEAFKLKCRSEGKLYQSEIKELMRQSLLTPSGSTRPGGKRE